MEKLKIDFNIPMASSVSTASSADPEVVAACSTLMAHCRAAEALRKERGRIGELPAWPSTECTRAVAAAIRHRLNKLNFNARESTAQKFNGPDGKCCGDDLVRIWCLPGPYIPNRVFRKKS